LRLSNLLAVQDVRRAFRAHHGNFRAGPGVGDIRAKVFAAHDHIRASVSFARDHADLGDAGFGVGEQHFGAVADDAAVLLVHPRQKTGRVHEGYDRQIEGIAEAHHPADFVGRVNIHHARHAGRFLGNNAHRSAVQARQANDSIGSEAGLNFEEGAAVHDLLNSSMQTVGFVRVDRHERVQSFRAS